MMALVTWIVPSSFSQSPWPFLLVLFSCLSHSHLRHTGSKLSPVWPLERMCSGVPCIISFLSHIQWGQLLPPLGNGYLPALISSPSFHSFPLNNSKEINASTFRCWPNLYLNLQIHPGPVPWRQNKLLHFISVGWDYCPGLTKSPSQYILIFMN